ncbi:MAG: DUF3536 domain-containing protein [Nitrospiraceae bacterium]|nr:DUF3536 domain-containing protein [Nitrospiraceae bacterium]
MKKNSFLTIHAHFYQPPRENAWLETIEIQDSAYPYHDWNERITAECYAANAFSRILGGNGRINLIVNNYKKISFNFGPTLLSWLKESSPRIHDAIVQADRESAMERSGHGNALAQCYNHMIMPLANGRDKKTQVTWGIEDFRSRFGRDPEGMWLPETAVDTASLEALAGQGIKFTVLAPGQAHRVRPIGSSEWTHVDEGSLDIRRAYRVNLPAGRSIAVFFYNGPVSRAVAFEGLLKNGEDFAKRLAGQLSGNGEPQLAHIATDGESYGHHSRFADMALAYCLHYIEQNGLARLTNYGEFLEKNPPSWEAQVKENTSWSCFHGVERWRADCGCNTGGHPGWDQKWRTPLRQSLDRLRDRLAAMYEREGRKYFKDPWEARDRYISVVLDRRPENLEKFFASQGVNEKPGQGGRVAALKLLEMQRHSMLMFTSCGWFFDDISGIEAVQVLQYAGRAMQLYREFSPGGDDIEGEFLDMLSKARSNVKEQGNGRDIFAKQVKNRVLDLKKVMAHYAISSLYEDYSKEQGIYCFDVLREDYERLKAGGAEFAAGRVRIRSRITLEEDERHFAVLRMGVHDVNCGLCECPQDGKFEMMKGEIREKFLKGIISEAMRVMDKYVDGAMYSLKDLFTDEQRKIISISVKETLDDYERIYQDLYDRGRFLMGYLKELKAPIPDVFLATAGFVLRSKIIRKLGGQDVDLDRAGQLYDELAGWGLKPDQVELEFLLRKKFAAWLEELSKDPSPEAIARLKGLLAFAFRLPFDVNLWEAQNIYYFMAKSDYKKIIAGDKGAGKLADEFRQLGEALFFNTSEVPGAAR